VRPSRRRNIIWGIVAVVCAAIGVVATLSGSHSVARRDAANTRKSFHSAVTGINSTLKLAIAHEEDLITSSSTFFAGHPNATPREFAAWVGWASVVRRHPEMQRLTLVGIVPASALTAFADRLAGRPVPRPVPHTAPRVRRRVSSSSAGSSATSSAAAVSAVTGSAPSLASGTRRSSARGVTTKRKPARAYKPPRPAPPPFPLQPPGTRAFYCLALAELAAGPVRTRPHGIDYCASRHELFAARSSGKTVYTSASVDGSPALTLTTPVYAGNPAPHSVAARDGAFVGWVRTLVEPGVLVQQALRGRPGDAVLLTHGNGATAAAFAGGSADGGQHSSSNLRNGWSATVLGPTPRPDVLADRDGRWTLIAGCLLSLLLGALVFLLGTRRVAVPVPRLGGSKPEDLYDPLTGLPNRLLTMDRAERMVARASRQSGMLTGALLIDIDWFGDVNEKLGRDAGDQVLRTVAERLEQVVRDHDTVGRMEGDEFVIVVECAARGARLDALARRVIESLHKPLELEGFGPSFFLTASIGLAFGRYTSPEELLHDAGLALQTAKAAGKDRYTLYNANMRAVIEDRGLLEAELNAAILERQFLLLYQPIYDLASHKVVAVEALIRWRHPKRGILVPDDFIPLAEETGLIVPIGRAVLEEACARAAAWSVAGHRIGVSVMVTANQLNREGFAVDVRRALQQSGIEPSLLTLEIAEATVMADVTAMGERMEELKRLGVSIAIDDFGSGYAYRSDLQRMPLDYLKVDRRSLAASEDEDYRSWLLEAILVFARDLSLTVVAKGVETAEQLTNLRAMGCTMAQGYFMGDPASADTVFELFDSALPTAGAGQAGAAGAGQAAAAPTAGAGQAAAATPAADAGQAAAATPTADAGQAGAVAPTAGAGQAEGPVPSVAPDQAGGSLPPAGAGQPG
jgi:diguanylate cyclase (GGDEF)-like protein